MNASLIDQINRLYYEVLRIKIELEKERVNSAPPRRDSWQEFFALSEAISRTWKGPGAVEEVRSQRDKAY